MTGRELLLGSAFQLSVGGGDEEAVGTRWTAWGRAAQSRFDGEEEGLSLDGDVTTVTLGADATQGGWLAGVAVALSEGEGGFRDHADTDHGSRGSGTLESTLTSVHPYARLEVSERLTVWGTLGYGSGDLTLEVDGSGRWETDTSMRMAAVGARGVVVAASGADPLELAVRTDARIVRMTSDAADGAAGKLAASESGTSRVRVMLEGSRAFALAGGGTVVPSLEVGLRQDGGDAETGAGVELGGGLRYSDPASGLTVLPEEVKGTAAAPPSGAPAAAPLTANLSSSRRGERSGRAARDGRCRPDGAGPAHNGTAIRLARRRIDPGCSPHAGRRERCPARTGTIGGKRRALRR